MTNEKIKSSLDDIITDIDIENLNKIISIKKNIMSSIGNENFIEFFKKAIDDYDNFNFTSEIKRKFIDKKDPIFTLRKIDLNIDKNQSDISDKNNHKYISDLVDSITNELNQTVLKNLSNYILEYVESNEELKNLYINTDDEMKELMWVNMFQIRVNPIENIINVRYIV